jgi:hypothetical protein
MPKPMTNRTMEKVTPMVPKFSWLKNENIVDDICDVLTLGINESPRKEASMNATIMSTTEMSAFLMARPNRRPSMKPRSSVI